jgi:histidinol-phosphate/aromatic aminotransferase/cobyric acid decarboxylase-like protein
MKRVITIWALVLVAFNASSQLLDVINEVFYTDDGTVLGYPEGFTTYRIYARTVETVALEVVR